MSAEAPSRARIWSAQDLARASAATSEKNATDIAAVMRRQWFRVQTQRALLAVSIILILATGIGSQVPDHGFLRSVVAIAWVFVWAGLATLFAGRTLPLRQLVAFLVVGYFLIPALTVVIVGPIVALMGEPLGTTLAVPVFEEALKALPVLGLAWSTRKDAFGVRSLVDYLLAGFAVGSGFAIHEDLLWGRNLLTAEGPLAMIAPWAYQHAGISVVHPGWTALCGFGIGLIVLLRGRWFSWIAAIAVMALAVFEHIAWNAPGPIDLLSLVGGGTLVSVVLLLCFLATIGHGLMVRFWGDARDSDFARAPLVGLPPWKAKWHRAADYNRKRTQTHLAAWQREVLGVTVPPRDSAAALMIVAAEAAGVSR